MSLSYIKERFFPSFYANEAPRLIEFFGYYLEWMEQEDNPYWTIGKLSEFTDIEGSVEKYGQHLKNELMIDFPIDYAGDIKYIMRHLVMLYQSKGTIDSFKFFFRAMYNSFCEITYPRQFMLKVSDGKWTQGYYIYTADIPETEYKKLIGKTVIEEETGITGLVNNIVPHFFRDEEQDKLVLRYVLGIIDNIKNFTEGNHLRVHGSDQVFTITSTDRTKGYWSNTDGLISSDKVLQDSYYYQIFSYEISSLVSIEEYRDIVQKLLHPAGLKMFGQVKLNGELEEMEKDNITFIRWWVITWLVHLLAEERKLLQNIWTIRNNPIPGQFPWTADQQYYNKQYGLVSNVSNMTPNELFVRTNQSNKLLFNNGRLIPSEWATYKIPASPQHYDVIGIRAKYPPVSVYCKNGIIELQRDQQVSDIAFIFVNGKKVRDSHITRTYTGIMLRDRTLTGTATIYSLDDKTIRRALKENIESSELRFLHSTKEQLVAFLDGIFISDNIEYSDNTINFPYSDGYLELYELQNNEELFVEHYSNTTAENLRSTLYHKNPLRNLISNLTDNDYYYINKYSYSVYQFPWTADQQYYNKQYGIISNVSDMTPGDLDIPTNKSNKLVFKEGILIEPNWGKYEFDTVTNNYCIAGIRAYHQSIHGICKDGVIDIVDSHFPDPDKCYTFIFIDGIKVPDEYVTKTDTGYLVPDTYSGKAVIYYLDKPYVSRSIRYQILNNSKLVKQLEKSSPQRFIVFQNGKFVWDSIRYERDKLWLPKSKGYVEIYEFVPHEDLFVFEYFIENKNNKTLYCYNPLRNILCNTTKNDERKYNEFRYRAYKFPWTADLQYFYKQYGLASNIQEYTPAELLTFANASNKLVFASGKLIEPDWCRYTLPFPSRKYYLTGLHANKYVIKARCEDGYIRLENENLQNPDFTPFVFIDGKKIPEKYVIRTDEGFCIATGISGRAIIYFPRASTIRRSFTYNITKNTKFVYYSNPDKQHSLIFQNGNFVWDKTQWHRNRIVLPETKGFIEIYEFIDHEDLLTLEYDIGSEDNRNFYCYNPIAYTTNGFRIGDYEPGSSEDTKDPYVLNSYQHTPFVYTYSADNQFYNKEYGSVSGVSDITPLGLEHKTNASNKLVFADKKLIVPDWKRMSLPRKTDTYYMTGIRTEAIVSKVKADKGIIRCSRKVTDASVPFIFVNGYKIKDSDIERTEYGYRIPETYTGTAIIYYPYTDIIVRSYKKPLTSNIIDFPASNKNNLLIFLDGQFIWNLTEYKDGKIRLPFLAGYIEIYELLNNEELFTVKYKIDDKNNKTLYCHNPVKSISTLSTITKEK